MAEQWQFRRGTTAQNDSFVGAIGEVTIDTVAKNLRIHDGSTTGGFIINNSNEVVHKSGNETIAGVKTFSDTIDGNISGSSGSCTGNAATATSATSATTATKATQDENGNNIVTTYAPKISPAFTGTPTAPTVVNTTDNSTSIATTAFVTNILDAVYPVGSIYIGTQSTCPMATLIPNSTWIAIEGRYLLASGTLSGTTSETYVATDTVAAGAPNITGTLTQGGLGRGIQTITKSGVFTNSYKSGTGHNASVNEASSLVIDFNASLSNSIYGGSTTVRSPAYVVNVWRRTA